MAALIDETYMRQTFKIHKDVGMTRVTPYIAVADRRLKKWVGQENYANSELTEILKLAEGLLTMHYLILNLNTNIRPQGLIKTESAEGNVTLQYLSPTETAQSAQAYLDQADEIIRDLIDYAVEDGFEIVTDDKTKLGDTWGEWLT